MRAKDGKLKKLYRGKYIVVDPQLDLWRKSRKAGMEKVEKARHKSLRKAKEAREEAAKVDIYKLFE